MAAYDTIRFGSGVLLLLEQHLVAQDSTPDGNASTVFFGLKSYTRMKFGCCLLVFCVVRSASATSHPEALNLLLADKESQINDLAAKALDAYETGCVGAPSVSWRVTCVFINMHTAAHLQKGAPHPRTQPAITPAMRLPVNLLQVPKTPVDPQQKLVLLLRAGEEFRFSTRSYANTCHVDMDVGIAGERTCCAYADLYRRDGITRRLPWTTATVG